IVEPNPENILRTLERNTVDIVLLDMNFKSAINTGNEGLFWLGKIKSQYPHINVVMITAYGAVDLAVRSLKQGASDFIVKPWQNEHLLQTDRKSTRLNSSHVKISYAVFCLKK